MRGRRELGRVVDSILGPLAGWSHFDETGKETGHGFNEVALGDHDGVDVFVDGGHFVDAGGKQGDASLVEQLLGVFPLERVGRFLSAHDASRSVGGGVERRGFAFTAYHVGGTGHRTGDDAEHTFARGRGSFAVDNHFFPVVRLLPGEIVMVLDVDRDLHAEIRRNVFMDTSVIGGGVLAHEFHGGPVFLARLVIQVEPRQVYELGRQLGMERTRERAKVRRHVGAGAAASAVAHESKVGTGLDPEGAIRELDFPELDEVVAAAARAELFPGFVFEAFGDGRDVPVAVHDVVLTGGAKEGADAEFRLLVDRPGEASAPFVFQEFLYGSIGRRSVSCGRRCLRLQRRE